MSDSTVDGLNIREQMARIDRNQAEIQKLFAETAKLNRIDRDHAEVQKLFAEARKLTAEAAKLNRDRFLAPALALAATLGAIATFAPAIIRAIGGHG